MVIVANTPIDIGITVIFMFHNFSVLYQGVDVYHSLHFLFYFIQWSTGAAKSTIRKVLFFCWLWPDLVVWPKLGDPIVSQNFRECCASHFHERIMVCAFIICSNDKISQFFFHNSSFTISSQFFHSSSQFHNSSFTILHNFFTNSFTISSQFLHKFLHKFFHNFFTILHNFFTNSFTILHNFTILLSQFFFHNSQWITFSHPAVSCFIQSVLI